MSNPAAFPTLPPSPYDSLIVDVAAHFNLPLDLLRAQIMQESSGNPYAFRYEEAYFRRYILPKLAPDALNAPAAARYGPHAACSYGLLQILLETACEHGFADRPERLFEPRVGLYWGALYLKACLTHVGGDLLKALARYNGSGPAAAHYAEQVFARAGRTV